MTVGVMLLLGTALVSVVAPHTLRTLARRAVDPVVVLVGWALAAVGVLGTGAAGLVFLAVPGLASQTPLDELVHGPWWHAVSGAPTHVAYRVVGWLALGALLAGLLRLAWVTVRDGRARRIRVRTKLDVVRLLGTPDPASGPGAPLLWLSSASPVAFSLGGRPGAVVLADGLRERLPGAGVDAVVAHERAHVRGRHHLLVAVVEGLARALPFVPLFVAAPGAVREQVELVADISAVRACGADAMRAALLAVTGAGTPAEALAMARDAVDLRLRYLAAAAEPPTAASRLTGCGVLGAAFASIPLLAASGLLIVLSVLTTAAAVLH
ncbi:M56 family metallopeptidase [Pseudonocardia sp.]|uniref:M56 family metallopeptidase n=1 Tax=Pseudonocardia sp. TaxID=60912 RepID=UPI0031FBFEDD